jgi:hypothetical protein
MPVVTSSKTLILHVVQRSAKKRKKERHLMDTSEHHTTPHRCHTHIHPHRETEERKKKRGKRRRKNGPWSLATSSEMGASGGWWQRGAESGSGGGVCNGVRAAELGCGTDAATSTSPIVLSTKTGLTTFSRSDWKRATNKQTNKNSTPWDTDSVRPHDDRPRAWPGYRERCRSTSREASRACWPRWCPQC